MCTFVHPTPAMRDRKARRAGSCALWWIKGFNKNTNKIYREVHEAVHICCYSVWSASGNSQASADLRVST